MRVGTVGIVADAHPDRVDARRWSKAAEAIWTVWAEDMLDLLICRSCGGVECRMGISASDVGLQSITSMINIVRAFLQEQAYLSANRPELHKLARQTTIASLDSLPRRMWMGYVPLLLDPRPS